MSDELQSHDQGFGPPTYWSGHGEGGPLDGAAINVTAVDFLQMRGLCFYICVGEEVESAEWHAYTFGQRLNRDTTAVEGFFKHLGTIEGDPPNPA